MSEGKCIGCSMGKIIVTKKIAATHKYVAYLCMEFYILLTKIHLIASLLLLTPFPVHLCIYVAFIKWRSVCST